MEPLVLTDDEGRTIEGVLNVLLNRSLTQPKADETDEALLKIILDLIMKRQRVAPADPVVSAVIRAIAASYNDPEFQVTEALIGTGYSKDYVRRRFLRETGVTPIDYLKRIRIRYAKSLLARKETLRMPVSEIALRSGFHDAAYFCRSFHQRRRTGCSAFNEVSRGGMSG